MKWLLITNAGNPGDIWVRLGVQQIIRRLDPDPSFNLRERDFREGDPHEGLKEPAGGLTSDYVVICGMPLLWSHVEADSRRSSTVQHASWPALTGWLLPEKRVIIAGFGILLACSPGLGTPLLAEPEILPQIQGWFDRCLLVYSRSPLVKQFFPKIESLHCPSVMALPDQPRRDLKLCNFMPGGGHYSVLNPDAAKFIDAQMRVWAPQLIRAGFHFVAHRPSERDLALELGWPKGGIFTWKDDASMDCLLDIYARCSKYFGNRVHGGIMSRGVGADVVVVGYDTRLMDVISMGGQAYMPPAIPDFSEWFEAPARALPYDMKGIRRSHLSWWSSKLKLPIL